MIVAPKPKNDEARSQIAKAYAELGEVERSALNEIAELASRICGAPISLVTFITDSDQLIKGSVGLGIDRTSRDDSFCSHAILGDELFQIEDTWEDERFHDNPLVTEEPNIRFYAGMPIETVDGENLGSLCVIDREPRKLTEDQIMALKVLSEQVMKRLELSKVQKQLEERNEALEKISHLRSRLLGVLAHDIRGPLSSIRVIVDLLKGGELTEDEKNDLGDSLDTVMDQTDSLLENILEWGKTALIDNGQESEVNVAEVIHDVVQLAELQAGLKRLRLISTVHLAERPRMNENVLRLSLRNLVGNAIKFSQDSTIEINAEKEGSNLNLSVTDHGTTLTEEMRQKILSNRVIRSTSGTKGEKGTGLGLSFVKELLSTRNAEMDIRINSDSGSTFIIRFKGVYS